jgi:choline dehydrogenase-like flavoprotein
LTDDLSPDVLVVGSGAGGAVVACRLAAAGMSVVVLERGPWVSPKDMAADEMSMIGRLYKDGGAQMNTDADMFVLQGSVVGGSTVLTNGVCFRMPSDVRARWASEGFPLDEDDLSAAYDRVEADLAVAPMDERTLNAAAGPLRRGLEALGIEWGRFRKNFRRCVGCGACNVGCRYGRKMDASRTWIPWAVGHGARVLARCEAVSIEHRGGRVQAVRARRLDDGRALRITPRRTVLAAGAVGTPELLLKSGIASTTAGRRTSFHVGSIVAAEMPEDIDAFDGDPMGVHFSGPGYLAEQLHSPPASFALTLPGWYDRHHGDLGLYRRLTAAGVLVATEPEGRVFLGIGRRLLRPLFDHAEIRFRLSPSGLDGLRRAMKDVARVFLAAGAVRVLPPTGRALEIRAPADVERIDALVRTQADVTGFGTSHPQGGAVAGDDPRTSTVDRDFRVHGFEDLFVADASVFPSAVRVNPQLTVMALADLASRAIAGTERRGRSGARDAVPAVAAGGCAP